MNATGKDESRWGSGLSGVLSLQRAVALAVLKALLTVAATVVLASWSVAAWSAEPPKNASTNAPKEAPAGAATQAEADGFAKVVKPFVTRHCVSCHGAKTQKADRRFDQLTAEVADDNALVDLQDILDQLNLGAMPPEDEPQPSDQQRNVVVEWLTLRIARHHESRQGGVRETVLRRLNAREYLATVRDLFQLNTTMFDPTVEFPRDQVAEHLDNVGAELVMSGHLLAKYLQAAELVVDKAMGTKAKPEAQTWVFRDGFRQQPEIDQVHRKTNGFDHMTLYDVVGADKHEGAYGPILAFREGVPHDGYYEIRLKAEAVNRQHPYDPKFLGMDPYEPLRLGIVAGRDDAGPLHKPQPMEPLLAELDLADEVQWRTVRVWLDRGCTPRFTFRNGLMDARTLWTRLVRTYADQFPPKQRGGIVETRFNAIKYGKLPHIRIHEIEIRGPYYDQWPTATQRAAMGDDWEAAVKDDSYLTDERIERRLAALMEAAYRRPVTSPTATSTTAASTATTSSTSVSTASGELQRVMRVVGARIDGGASRWEAMADGMKMVLCSPNFLYLDEPADEDGKLTAHGLASRLSYFLWSSMPDAELRRLADHGSLSDEQVLSQQVERMLEDPRSDAFVDGFLDSWLALRDLGATPPDRGAFRDYYQYHLREAMRRETHLFTRMLLEQNGQVFDFLDSDYAIVNKRLAALYGIPWDADGASVEPAVEASEDGLLSKREFRRLSLSDRRRGGLLGQASVLTVSANGIDTSPVVRGVWLLENLLGTPAPTPPPDVEPLDPDVRGAKTIREQLTKHRSIPSCYECHRKIDPLGFALENFDPIGRWRERYPKKGPIDASGQLPSGERFRDVGELKKLLQHQQKPLLARAVASKLLEYATGRHVAIADRPAIDAMANEVIAGAGFRDLVKSVVASEPFQRP